MTAHYENLLTPPGCGVYLAPAELKALRRAAAEAGLAWLDVDLARVTDKQGLLAACRQALSLPHTFGSNWDALADCLQDLSWRDAPGYVINLMQTVAMARTAPQDFQQLLEILSDAARYWQKRGTVFIALVDCQTGGLPDL